MPFEQYLHQTQTHFEEKLEFYLEKYTSTSPLYSALRYVVLGGGKRIRPLIIYTIGDSFGLQYATLDQAACALEIIHCYSLVHDDLPAMDDDDYRRGKPSCHKKFDEATAILVGDALQALAFEILAEPNAELPAKVQLEMISSLSKAAGACGIVGGQSRDIQMIRDVTSHAELDTIHKEKTASLFQAAIEMVTIQLQPRPDIEKLGELLGLAFQLQDDLLEVSSSALELGKPTDSDEKNTKTTHHYLLGYDNAKVILDKYFKALENLIKSNLPKPEHMLNILHTLMARSN